MINNIKLNIENYFNSNFFIILNTLHNNLVTKLDKKIKELTEDIQDIQFKKNLEIFKEKIKNYDNFDSNSIVEKIKTIFINYNLDTKLLDDKTGLQKSDLDLFYNSIDYQDGNGKIITLLDKDIKTNLSSFDDYDLKISEVKKLIKTFITNQNENKGPTTQSDSDSVSKENKFVTNVHKHLEYPYFTTVKSIPQVYEINELYIIDQDYKLVDGKFTSNNLIDTYTINKI